MKPALRIDPEDFERLASQTRMGAKAREMARLTLVEGRAMQAVAACLGTIPQRVRLAVGSIHRVQASLTWCSPSEPSACVPERPARPWPDLLAELRSLGAGVGDEQVIAELESLMAQARQRLTQAHRCPRPGPSPHRAGARPPA